METLSLNFKFVKTAEKEVVKCKIKELIVREIWDSHGDYHTTERKTFNNCEIRVVRTSGYYDFGNKNDSKQVYDTDTLYINGEEYNALDIYEVKGTENKLNITACIGQG